MHTPFNGDDLIGVEIRKLIAKYKIKTIIETGCWSAHTSREFATMGPEVITIDSTWNHLVEEFGPNALDDLITKHGIHPILGDSSKCLKEVIKNTADHPVLFYLDAHGGGENNSNVNPLLEELAQIGDVEECRDNCVTAIHDFYVPGKDFGYNGGDWGRGFEPLSLELIRPSLNRVYLKGFDYHYNKEAHGMQRGVIYIAPFDAESMFPGAKVSSYV